MTKASLPHRIALGVMLIVATVALVGGAFAQTARPTAARWEYRVDAVQGLNDIAMTRAGAEGWELLQVVASGGSVVMIYKRPAR